MFVFNVLWDMGGEQTSEDLRDLVLSEVMGQQMTFTDRYNFETSFGGLHDAKAITNAARRYVLSHLDMNFSIKTLISLKSRYVLAP